MFPDWEAKIGAVAFFKYLFIRAALFVPLFVLFLFLHLSALLAVGFAVVIAFCLSYLFFREQRDAATAAMHNRFAGKAAPIRGAQELSDAASEDALVDHNPHVGVDMDSKSHRNRDVTLPFTEAGSVPRDFLEQ